MEPIALQSAIESILFVSDRPVTFDRLVEVFGETANGEEPIKEAVSELIKRYTGEGYGYELRETHGGYHFVTRVSNAEWVRKFLSMKPFRLGKSALEVLAIVAYRQPITRAEIDQVRGIDSSHLMRTLIERNLVRMCGKAEVPGRPVQYSTTERFLEVVGLRTLSDLPPLSELEQLQGHTEDPLKALEEGLERALGEVAEGDSDEDKSGIDEGLEEISSLIQSTQTPMEEVYSSPDQAEIARENQCALDGFLATWRARRKTRNPAPKVEAEPEPEILLAPTEEPPSEDNLKYNA